jgi:hypothetical protein
MSSDQNNQNQQEQSTNQVNSLRAVIAKCDEDRNNLMNTAAVENSRLESVVNAMNQEMNRFATSKQEYDEAKAILDKNKEVLANSLKKIEEQRQKAEEQINTNLAKGDQQLIKQIQEASRKASNEGLSHFTAGKTPDQFNDEESKKGFTSTTGKEVIDPKLTAIEQQQQQNQQNQQNKKNENK